MKFWCVFKKELQLYYGSFIAYALSMALLVLAGYFSYTDMIFYDLFGDFMDITTKDVFFVMVTLVFLYLTPRSTESRKWRGTR